MSENIQEHYKSQICLRAKIIKSSEVKNLGQLPLESFAIFAGKCLGGKLTANTVAVFNQDGTWFVTDDGRLSTKNYKEVISFLESVTN